MNSFNARSGVVSVRRLVLAGQPGGVAQPVSGPGFSGYAISIDKGAEGVPGLAGVLLAFAKAGTEVRIGIIAPVAQRASLLGRALGLARAAAARL